MSVNKVLLYKVVFAGWFGDQEVLSLFLAYGYNMNFKTSTSWIALSSAAWNGHIYAVNQLLVSSSIDAFIRGLDASPVLLYTADGGYKNIVRRLINYGLDIDGTDKNRQTALFCAAERGHIEVVKELLTSKCTVKIRD